MLLFTNHKISMTYCHVCKPKSIIPNTAIKSPTFIFFKYLWNSIVCRKRKKFIHSTIAPFVMIWSGSQISKKKEINGVILSPIHNKMQARQRTQFIYKSMFTFSFGRTMEFRACTFICERGRVRFCESCRFCWEFWVQLPRCRHYVANTTKMINDIVLLYFLFHWFLSGSEKVQNWLQPTLICCLLVLSYSPVFVVLFFVCASVEKVAKSHTINHNQLQLNERTCTATLSAHTQYDVKDKKKVLFDYTCSHIKTQKFSPIVSFVYGSKFNFC